MEQPETSVMNRIVALCKRRGFVFPASEIYGGINGFWDFGPLGVQLKNNLRDAWWHDMVECSPTGPDGKPLSIVGLDSAIIQHPKTWVASGHVGGFADLMVECSETNKRYRFDHMLCFALWEPIITDAAQIIDGVRLSFVQGDDETNVKILKKIKKLRKEPNFQRSFLFMEKVGNPEARVMLNEYEKYIELGYKLKTEALKIEHMTNTIGPDAENPGTLTEPRAFNLMFESYAGVFQNEDSKVYLRPETAQGIFLEFKNVMDSTRVRPPFGIAQIGKAFRNEVTPRNFIFRTREFEQMEMEFFVPPEDGMKWYEFWVDQRMRWWQTQGLRTDNLFRHEIPEADRSFYSSATSDIEYRYPFTAPGFGELEGVAYRTDYDLKQHQTHSRVNLEYIDQENANRRYLPHVIEPASGLTRGVLALLCEAYQYDESRASPEWLKIKPSLAPIKAGIFPLINKDGMPEIAEKLYLDLRRDYVCQYDAKQSIGKRYARMDEAGTPFCITVDGETLKDQAVTIRSRDTAQQERVALDKVKDFMRQHLAG